MVAAVHAGPWVAREHELALLDRALHAVAVGRGGVMLVGGEPGIGKSALVEVGLAGAEAAGCRLVVATADEVTGRFPLLVLTDALSPGRPSAAVASPATAVERLLSRVDELSAAGPVVLVVEDLHWADEASLLAFSRLVRAAAQQPLLLVGTARPVPVRPELARLRRLVADRGGMVVELPPLSEADSVELAGRLTGAPSTPRLRRLAAAAGGNPLYVREIADALARDGTAGATSTPLSVAGAISDRLGFLRPGTAEALRGASLLGGDFPVTDLAAVLGRAASSLVPAVDEALAAGVLAPAGERMRFRHALIRDALYESMPPSLRAALHRQAAEALAVAGAAPGRVAAQLLLAPGPDAWEAGWLAEHGDALSRQAPRIAEELLARVVEQPLADESLRDRLEQSLVSAALRCGSTDLLERVAWRALSRGVDLERRGLVTGILGYLLMRTGRTGEAHALVERALAQDSIPPIWRVRMRSLRAAVLLELGRHQDAEVEARDTLRAARGCADPAATGFALHSLAALAAARGDLDAASSLARQVSEVVRGRVADSGELPVLALMNLANWSVELDRFADAEEALREGRGYDDRDAPSWLAPLWTVAVRLDHVTGRWDDALAELEAADVAPDDPAVLLRHGLSALIAVHRDRSEDAAAQLAAAGPVRPGAPPAGAAYLLMARAAVAERTGGPAAAVAVLAPALDRAVAVGPGDRSLWLPELVRLALATGERGLAEAAAAAAGPDLARGSPAVTARWCRALLEGDLAGLDGCAAHFRAVGRVPALGSVLEDAAATAAAAGDAAGARHRLNEAVEVYLGLGAEWDVRRADARLRALGVRRGQRSGSRRPVSGWAALTPTEVRVAELVAQGRSNPEVAAVLFLSRRTVQTHVTHILAKLGIHARGEIATALDRPRP